jgi:hypothetical protein
MQSRSLSVAIIVLAAVATQFICADARALAPLRLSIGTAAGSTGETVEVPVLLSGSSNASTIIFGIAFDSQSLQLVAVGEGDALKLDQIVISSSPAPGTVGISAWGNNNVIANGELCIVTFRILSAASGAVGLNGAGQPSAASLLGAALPATVSSGEVFINCDGTGPDAPASVTASKGAASGVTVSWSAAAGASEYRVYRAKTSAPGAVEAVSDWMAGVTSWVDASAAGPGESVTIGCQGGGPLPVHYYYWVRARDEGGCPSGYSQAAEGWRGPDTAKAASVSAGPMGVADAGLFAAAAMLLAACARIKNRCFGNKAG